MNDRTIAQLRQPWRSNYGLLFDFGVRQQLLSTQCDRRNLLLTLIVVGLYDAKVEQEARQLLIAVAILSFEMRSYVSPSDLLLVLSQISFCSLRRHKTNA